MAVDVNAALRAQFDERWFAPVPITVDAVTGEYQVEIWSLDRRYRRGRCLISRHPVPCLGEGAVLSVLRDHWPEFSWAWVGAWNGFFRRNSNPKANRK